MISCQRAMSGLSQTACIKQEEGGDDVKSVWPRLGLYVLQCSVQCEPIPQGGGNPKTGLVRLWAATRPHEAESLVMAHQLRCRELLPGLVHTARHIMEAARTRSTSIGS